MNEERSYNKMPSLLEQSSKLEQISGALIYQRDFIFEIVKGINQVEDTLGYVYPQDANTSCSQPDSEGILNSFIERLVENNNLLIDLKERLTYLRKSL